MGGARPVEAALDDLRRGFDRMSALFGTRFLPVVAAPWNRIAPEVAARVHECGFTALSTSSWHRTGTLLPEINTQVDIMDWTGGRIGHRLEAIAAEVLRRLQQARAHGGAPLGILTHHLVHDETAWATLESLIAYLLKERGLAFSAADALV